MVIIQEDTCLVLGRTALPAYLLKIYALPCFIAPVTNLRNTALLQSALQDMLQIPPEHGIVIFNPVLEENLATNGTTVRGEIARLERSEQEVSPGLFKTLSRTMSRRRMKTSSGQSQPVSLPSTTEATSPLPHLPPYQSPPDVEPTQPMEQTKLEDRPTRFVRMRDSMKGLVYSRLIEAMEKCERDRKETKEAADTQEAKEAKEAQEAKESKGAKRSQTGKPDSHTPAGLQAESSQARRMPKGEKNEDEKQV